MQAPNSFEFCQVVDPATRQRCVAARGHGGRHDLQPLTSSSVQTIMRQEDTYLRLGYERPTSEDAPIAGGDTPVEGIVTVADDTSSSQKAPQGPQTK